MELAEALQYWEPDPGYLNTATHGLAPKPAVDALRTAIDEWRHGPAGWEAWDVATPRARAAFARLVGADPGDIAIGAAASQLVSIVAASLPPGSRVLVPEGEFTSNLFPWVVADAKVETVPLDRLADAIGPHTDVVAFSVVQSANGHIAAVDDIVTAARDHDALILADATQACGWLPVDATRFDVLVCAAYKWLTCPRGTAFAYLAPHIRDRLRPYCASWYAGADRAASYYGLPMRLAENARAFDVSPAFFSYLAAAPALELLNEIGIERIHRHNVALADRFLAALGLPPRGSAIVSIEVPDAERRLAAAGVRAAARGGRTRLSFHLYTGEADLERAITALT